MRASTHITKEVFYNIDFIYVSYQFDEKSNIDYSR